MTKSGAHIARPLWFSSGISIFAGLLAILFVANAPAQVTVLGVTLVGLVALAVGIELWHRNRRVLSTLVTLMAVTIVVVALIMGMIETQTVAHRVELIPGIFGLVVLLAGVMAVLRGYERWFVSAGTGILLMNVFASGLVDDASVAAMLAATAMTVIAWDSGEQAINMGEQVGRQARTRWVELSHGMAAVIVGVIGVVVALGFANVGVSGLPLLGLTALLGAAIVFGAGLST